MQTRRLLLAALIAIAVAGCGGGTRAGSPGDSVAAPGDSAAGFPGVGGGGGTLTFDGETIPIASAVCQLEADTFDVGTVSDNQFRVLVSLNNPQNPISVQILDADFLQWFPEGNPADPVTRSGGTFTSEELTYFNNADDRTIQASFSIECP